MFAWSSHGTELKRFARQPITRAAIVVMLLIPLLYGAMYVWAFWDPTTHMDELPVALVNADVPTTDDDGETVHYGTDVVDTLLEDASIGWVLTDATTAADGVNAGRYYFAVTIPESFSADIVSLSGDSPAPASIEVSYDDSNSFLASTLGRTAMTEVRDAVDKRISKRAVDTLLVGVGDARDGFAKASDGAFRLRDGLSDASNGADRLNVGAQDLAAGAATLASGTVDLSDGADELADSLDDYVDGVTTAADGVRQLASGADSLGDLADGLAQAADTSTGAPALAAGVRTLAGDLGTLTAGVTRYASGATSFADGAGDWVDGAGQWLAAVSDASGGSLLTGTRQVADGAAQLAASTASSGKLAGGASALEQGADGLAGGLSTLQDAVDKAEQLTAAGRTDDALAVLDQVKAGLKDAKSSASELSAGAGQVRDGIATVHDGASQLSDGAGALESGWSAIHEAVADGGAVASGLDRLAAGQQQLDTSAGALTAGAAALADPATLAQVQQLVDGSADLAAAVTTMSAGASTGLPALQQGLADLSDGFTAADPHHGLVSGAKALRAGAATLADGLDTARAGARKVSDGSTTIADNTPDLAAGLVKAGHGSARLGHKLADAAREIPDDSSALRHDRAVAVARPVTLDSSHVHQADSWGEGFAPFFISLALWVGALITWLLLRPLQTRALMTSVNGFRAAWGSLNSALLISVGQVLIMLSVMHLAIGLDPKNVVATVAFTLLTAAAFFALQQFFQVTLGSAVGKVVIIVALMVQLASAGGTYPIQTTPAFLQAISPWMPMTYAVNGLREAITGGIETRFWTSVAVLAAIFVVSLLATSVATAHKRMWTISRLHPALSI